MVFTMKAATWPCAALHMQLVQECAFCSVALCCLGALWLDPAKIILGRVALGALLIATDIPPQPGAGSTKNARVTTMNMVSLSPAGLCPCI